MFRNRGIKKEPLAVAASALLPEKRSPDPFAEQVVDQLDVELHSATKSKFKKTARHRLQRIRSPRKRSDDDSPADVMVQEDEDEEPEVLMLDDEDELTEVDAQSKISEIVVLTSSQTLESSPGDKMIQIRFQFKERIRRVVLTADSTIGSIRNILCQEFQLPEPERLVVWLEDERIGTECRCDSVPRLNPLTGILRIGLMTDQQMEEERSAADAAARKEQEQKSANEKLIDPNTVTIDGHIRVRTMISVKKSHADCVSCTSRCPVCRTSAFLTSAPAIGHKRTHLMEQVHHLPQHDPVSGFMEKIRQSFLQQHLDSIPEQEHSLIRVKFTFDCDELTGSETPEQLDLEHGSQIEVSISDSRSCGEVSCSCDQGSSRRNGAAAAAAASPDPPVASETDQDIMFLDDEYACHVATAAAASAASAHPVSPAQSPGGGLSRPRRGRNGVRRGRRARSCM